MICDIMVALLWTPSLPAGHPSHAEGGSAEIERRHAMMPLALVIVTLALIALGVHGVGKKWGQAIGTAWSGGPRSPFLD